MSERCATGVWTGMSKVEFNGLRTDYECVIFLLRHCYLCPKAPMNELCRHIYIHYLKIFEKNWEYNYSGGPEMYIGLFPAIYLPVVPLSHCQL